MIFLRVTPFFPNWLINIAAPVVEVPFIPFWLGTFIGSYLFSTFVLTKISIPIIMILFAGVAPPSFVAIQAGQTLHQLTSVGGTWSWNSIILLAIFAVTSLLPVYLKERLKPKSK